MARPTDPHSTPAILVVDDEADIRALVADALGAEGYRVLVAATHREALAALSTLRFALVLTDTAVASVADGGHWAGLGRLLAAAGDTPVIISSAHDPLAFADHATRGFAGVLPKPFGLDELLSLAAALARPAPSA